MNNSNYTDLPHIDQHTIECDLRAFTRWLNALADRINWLTKIYIDLEKRVSKNEDEIRKLKVRVDNIEIDISNLKLRVTNLESAVNNLTIRMNNLEGVMEMLNQRVDMLYSWLPVPYGMIDPLGWKFAMGNINAMSTQEAPSNINGPGIYTRGSVGNNDVNFK